MAQADRAVRLIRPAGFIFENVRGLTRAAFADYLRWIMLSLAMPDVEKSPKEDRAKHLKRLEAALEKDEGDVRRRTPQRRRRELRRGTAAPPRGHPWPAPRPWRDAAGTS